MYSLTDTVVIFLSGPKADDGVGDCGSIDWGEASYCSQDHSILHTVVAWEKKKKNIQDLSYLTMATNIFFQF